MCAHSPHGRSDRGLPFRGVAGESARESARRQREKAERLLRAAEMNDRGADGEETTAAVLAGLPTGQWTVLHDLRWPGRRFANVDHVVIGPPGVFVIDSKNWSGQITVRDNVLRQNGYKREPAVAGAAEAALAVAQLTDVVSADRVRPVLCFVGDELLTGWARDVMVCSTRNLLHLLNSRPRTLTSAQVQFAALQLDAHLSAPDSSSASARSVRRVPRQPRLSTRPPRGPRKAKTGSKRRQGPRLVRLLVGMALVGVLIFEPRLVTGIGQRFAELIVSQTKSTT